jgi:hypothetical protein
MEVELPDCVATIPTFIGVILNGLQAVKDLADRQEPDSPAYTRPAIPPPGHANAESSCCASSL